MKFCQRKIYTYKQNNIDTVVHYVSLKDVYDFHGKEFTEKWKEFIKNKSKLQNEYFYYEDYKFAARQADSFLNTF